MNDIILKHISTYFLKTELGKTKIYLYYPYHPFQKTSKDYVKIDAYYLASNALYHIVQNLLKELSRFNARMPLLNIKQEFLDAGLAVSLRNSLIAIPPYGSRVALSIIEIDGEYSIDRNDGMLVKNYCLNCNLCQKRCPTQTLDDGIFNRSNCLRHMQDGTNASVYHAKLMDKMVLGCDICQSKCPYNSAMTQAIPPMLLEILYLPTFIPLLQKGRKELAILERYIGKNMVRRKRLLYYAILSLGESQMYLLDSIASDDLDIMRAIEEVKISNREKSEKSEKSDII